MANRRRRKILAGTALVAAAAVACVVLVTRLSADLDIETVLVLVGGRFRRASRWAATQPS